MFCGLGFYKEAAPDGAFAPSLIREIGAICGRIPLLAAPAQEKAEVCLRSH
jgi:hypothetical protein